MADLVTMFFGRYLPPELAVDLIERVPAGLVPPELDLTPEQRPFARGFLTGLSAIRDRAGCEVAIDQVAPPSPWSDNVPIPDQLSKAAPALASHNGLLHMVHLGDSSNTIWHSMWDDSSWSENKPIPGQKSKAACALASHNGLQPQHRRPIAIQRVTHADTVDPAKAGAIGRTADGSGLFYQPASVSNPAAAQRTHRWRAKLVQRPSNRAGWCDESRLG